MIFRKPFLFLLLLILCGTTCCTLLSPGGSSSAGVAYNRNDQLRKDVVKFARQQLGARYKYGGRTPKGFDCSGLTHYVMGNYGITLSPNSAMQSSEGKPIDLRKARAGDLVFFKRSKLGKVFHVALIVANNSEGIQVVHSTSSRGVILENITKSSYWAPKIWTSRSVLP